MPETLVRRIEALATKVEQALSGGRGVVVIQLDAGEQKVVEFLHMQARIRAELPMRILTTCQECRFQKVSNPDLGASAAATTASARSRRASARASAAAVRARSWSSARGSA